MYSFDLSPEQQQLKETVHRFAVEEIIPVAAEYDRKEDLPLDVCRKAWELGFLNPQIPTEYGGLGLGVMDTCLIDEEMIYGCAGIALNMVANNLAALPLLIAGTEEQKKKYLGWLVEEPAYGAFALTEPGAGSDAGGISTSYRKVGDEYVLNGTKHFITNGTIAQWYAVFATQDKDVKHGGISCFVLPSDTPGITANRMHNKMGQRASDTAEIVFEDVKVPREGLVGAEGAGFKVAMRTFDHSRPEVGAFSIGISQRALDESVKYSQERETFGADQTMKITTDAVQIFGGYGYLGEYPVEKLMRDAKLLQIYEGTSQIQRVVIARHLLKGQ